MKKYLLFYTLSLCSLMSAGQELTLSEHIGGTANAVVPYNHYLYYNTGGDIRILDISDPDNVVEINRLVLRGYFIKDICIREHYLFIATGYRGILIYDLSDPVNPIQFSSIPGARYTNRMLIDNGILIIAGDIYTEIYDISDISHPMHVSSISYASGCSRAYALKNHILYMSGIYGMEQALFLIGWDLSVPSDPVMSASLKLNVAYPWPTSDAMSVIGNHLLVAYNDTIKIFDIMASDTIIPAGFFHTPSPVYNMTAISEQLLTAMENGILTIYEVSNGTNPVVTGSFPIAGNPEGMVISGGLLSLAMKEEGCQVWDVSEPEAVGLVFENLNTLSVRLVYPVGPIAYLAMEPEGLAAFDMTDRSHPVPLGSIHTHGYILDLLLVNGYLYCVHPSDSSIYIVDVTNPDALTVTDTLKVRTGMHGWYTSGTHLYVMEIANSLKVFDCSNPAHPVLVDSAGLEGSCLTGNDSLLITANETPGYPYTYAICLYRYTPFQAPEILDTLAIGGDDEDRIYEIELAWPYIVARVGGGVVVAEIISGNTLRECDRLTGFVYTIAMCQDPDQIYLLTSGYEDLNVINREDPYHLFVQQPLSAGGFSLALCDTLLYVSEGNNGYSLYGYYPIGIWEGAEKAFRQPLRLFPNPAKGQVLVDLPDAGVGPHEGISLRCFNLFGREVWTQVVYAGTRMPEINTADWSPGLYFISVYQGNTLLTGAKLIVE